MPLHFFDNGNTIRGSPQLGVNIKEQDHATETRFGNKLPLNLINTAIKVELLDSQRRKLPNSSNMNNN